MNFFSKKKPICPIYRTLLPKVLILIGAFCTTSFTLKADGGNCYCYKIKAQTQNESLEGYWQFISYDKIHIDSLSNKDFLIKILPISKGVKSPLVLSKYVSKITFKYPDSSTTKTIYGFSKKKQFVIPVKDIVKLEIVNSCSCNKVGIMLINNLHKNCKWILKRPKEVHRYWFEGCAYVLLSYHQSNKTQKIIEQLKKATIEGDWISVNLLYAKINKLKIIVISEGC